MKIIKSVAEPSGSVVLFNENNSFPIYVRITQQKDGSLVVTSDSDFIMTREWHQDEPDDIKIQFKPSV